MSHQNSDSTERHSLEHDIVSLTYPYGPPNDFIEPGPQVPDVWDTALTALSYDSTDNFSFSGQVPQAGGHLSLATQSDGGCHFQDNTSNSASASCTHDDNLMYATPITSTCTSSPLYFDNGQQGRTSESHRRPVFSVGPMQQMPSPYCPLWQATSSVHHVQYTHPSTSYHTTSTSSVLPNWQASTTTSSDQGISQPSVLQVGASWTTTGAASTSLGDSQTRKHQGIQNAAQAVGAEPSVRLRTELPWSEAVVPKVTRKRVSRDHQVDLQSVPVVASRRSHVRVKASIGTASGSNSMGPVPSTLPKRSTNGKLSSLVTTLMDGKVTKYVCGYVNPLNPGRGPCGSILRSSYRHGWQRHLSTVHGRAEVEAIRDGRLALANAIALHDPDCREQVHTCPLDWCGWYRVYGQRWSIKSWGRLDRRRRIHDLEWHGSRPFVEPLRLYPRDC